jgi:hypothetical protein
VSWKTEHGEDFEVPGIIDFMVKKEILEDASWHNDTMPRFEVRDPKDEESGVFLWVDHPIGSERETGREGKRYMIQAGEFSSDMEFELETDDLEEALTAVLRLSAKHFPGHKPHWPGIVKEYMKSIRR